MNLSFVPLSACHEQEAYEIFCSVVEQGNSYIYEANTTLEQFRRIWLTASAARPYVAIETNSNEIVGTFVIRQNKIGRGSHVANAGFMVKENKRGLGIGSAMCKYALSKAKSLGFRSMQFNVVVSTNIPAVNLWHKMGFKILGTIPLGFLHSEFGYVDIYIMWQEL